MGKVRTEQPSDLIVGVNCAVFLLFSVIGFISVREDIPFLAYSCGFIDGFIFLLIALRG